MTDSDSNSAANASVGTVFLDANAGIACRPEALESFCRVEKDCPGNPSSLHRRGRRAQGELESARSRVARCLGRQDSEIVFTSGATEACNLALLGMVAAQSSLLDRKLGLLANPTEHPAVLGPLRMLQQDGHHLQWLPVDAHGRVESSALASALAPAADSPVDLVALQWANSETGALQPLQELADSLPPTALWFCDAVQGIGKSPLLSTLQFADSLVLSGHKFGAPKGIGAWALSERAPFEAPLVGGGQQAGRRPGTEMPALAAAFATALELALQEQLEVTQGWLLARKSFMQQLGSALKGAIQENHAESGLANTLNFSLPDLDGRLLLPALDAEGLQLSSGSACSSGSPTPSTTLLAIGLSQKLAKASVRISFPPNMSLASAAQASQRFVRVISRIYEVGKR